MPSIVGIGVSAEGYLGGYSGVSGVNGGARALLELRSLYLKAGVDYDVQREDTSFILSLTHAVAARRDPGPRHARPRRLAAWARQLVELRPAGPARAAHGEDPAAA